MQIVDLFKAIVDGITLLISVLKLGYDGHYYSAIVDEQLQDCQIATTGTDVCEELFPVAKTQTGEEPRPKRVEPFPNCPGCRGHQSSTDSRHTRILGECRYPDTESIEY